jgi:hypothetical protein
MSLELLQSLINRLLSPYGLAILVDVNDGHILASLHDRSGRLTSAITQITEDSQRNVIYFGSDADNGIVIMKAG